MNLTLDEVSERGNGRDGNPMWLLIDGDIYDVSKFAKIHPGGDFILSSYAGKDATEDFYSLHKGDVLAKYHKLKVGRVVSSVAQKSSRPSENLVSSHSYIDTATPYAEGPFFRGLPSPYFTEEHTQFKIAIRKFIEAEIKPSAESDEESGTLPSIDIYKKMGKCGILASRIGVPAMEFLSSQCGITLPNNLDPSKFDAFYEQIAHQEFQRIGYPGLSDGLGAGLVIGLPPIIHFGSDELRRKYVLPILSGELRVCLAISEPFAGSDVAGLQTRGTLVNGMWEISGIKKWITCGHFSNIFVTAVRTRDPLPGKGPQDGISLFVIDKRELANPSELKTTLIKTSYGASAGTALIFLDKCRVSPSQILGKVHDGFSLIMKNFNHERWLIICGVTGANRYILSECFKWASLRKVFGKPLISQPVIRLKLAQMSAMVEASERWLDGITFEMTKLSYREQSQLLAGPIALLKFYVTRTSNSISDDACQIFGGRAITRSGMGSVVEKFQRSNKFAAIYGGSEEIMADLAIKQTMKSLGRARL